MGTGQETHRSGGFKQTNKSHKTGRHRSKGAINAAAGGKVNIKTISRKAKQDNNREVRRLQSKQLRAKKRTELYEKKRNLIGSLAPPVLITIVPLQEDFDVQSVVTFLTGCDDSANVTHSPQGVVHISIPRFKQRFSLLVPPIGNTFATLDALKVSTTVLFVSSVVDGSGAQRTEIIDTWGEEILEAAKAQGLPTTIVAVTGLESIPIKKRHETKQNAQDKITKWISDEKLVALDKQTDALNLLRKAGNQKQKSLAFRTKRPHLLAEKVKYTSGSTDEDGVLEVSGYMRGRPLSVNGIVHIPGFGDFQMSQITAPSDPHPLEKAKKSATGVDMMDADAVKVLEVANPREQDSLDAENVPDPMDAEQTWPNEADYKDAARTMPSRSDDSEAGSVPKQKRKVLRKGTSEYQAAWILDDDCKEDLDDDDDFDSDSDDGRMSIIEERDEEDYEDENNAEDDDEEYETMTMSEAAPDEQKYDQQIDMYEELDAIKKLKQAKLDEQFPDEVDTPQDQLARERFQKYRGLESFRTSPWDPKENLPYDYSRIFQFANFERTRRRIFKEIDEQCGVNPGWYVTLHIKGIGQKLFNAFCTVSDRPLIVFGLLPNEQRMSLLNITLKRTLNRNEPIKSKERLVFQCGFRRFSTCPVFSQHTNAAKHKYVRYFSNDDTVVASMYAPITFPPCQVLCFKEQKNGTLELIAKGNILSADANRLVIKRAVLSGHPLKILKRSAVVRFMFFNREDIMWFKSVELRTKYGRRGHIKEPLGTHGHMKCVFDGQLKSQDTVLMNLYKRVFPKWTYQPCLLVDETSDDLVSME